MSRRRANYMDAATEEAPAAGEEEQPEPTDDNVENDTEGSEAQNPEGEEPPAEEPAAEGEEPAEGEESKPAEEGEEIDIDLEDPEVEQAAVKIQATFRGYKARKELAEGSEEGEDEAAAEEEAEG